MVFYPPLQNHDFCRARATQARRCCSCGQEPLWSPCSSDIPIITNLPKNLDFSEAEWLEVYGLTLGNFAKSNLIGVTEPSTETKTLFAAASQAMLTPDKPFKARKGTYILPVYKIGAR